MNRRKAIEKVSWILGSSIIGMEAFMSPSFAFPRHYTSVSNERISLLNEIGDIIFPTTDTPGAKEANVGAFMEVIVRDCYTKPDQHIFNKGIEEIEKRCTQLYGKGFLSCSTTQRAALLSTIEKEQRTYMTNRNNNEPVHYFRMLKELTLAGVYTSEIGATKLLNYNPAPGHYDGCSDLKPWN